MPKRIIANMNNTKATKTVFSVALLLLLIAAALMTDTYVGAQQNLIPTYAFSDEGPNPVGIGQTCSIGGWVIPASVGAGSTYENLTFIITKPNGTTDTIVVPQTRVEATASFWYTCDQLGTWSVVLEFPGDATHQSSTSQPYTWTVQTETIPETEHIPLPTGYWSFPINAENWEWYQISGPWYNSRFDASQTQFNPYSKGPNTPHILWRNQVVPGGLIGGQSGWNSMTASFNGTELNMGITNYVAAQGRLYYTTNQFQNDTVTDQPILHCVDQATGEEIYAVTLKRNASYASSFHTYALWLDITGVIKNGAGVQTPDQNGAYNIWVSGNGLWRIDAFTGGTMFYWPGMSGTYFNGNIYISNYPKSGNLSMFQASSLGQGNLNPVWTVQAGLSYISQDGIIVQKFTGTSAPYMKIKSWNATTGEMICDGADLGIPSSEGYTCVYDDKVYLVGADMRVHALSILTGQQVWQSEPMEYPWGAFQSYGQSAGYGCVYQGMLDGHIYCWNATTGELVWKYYSGDSTDTAYGTYPFWGNIVIADGKLYSATGEHTPPQPYPMGYCLYCIDAFTGDLVWKYPGFSTYTFAHVGFGDGISSGMLWYQNMQDGCLYMFGMGQSATQVSASPKVAAKGSAILIEGTVTDQSAGQPDTPAIADESMSDWMAYLYENAPMPTDAAGVEVCLTAIDSRNNTVNIGTTRSDSSGTFGMLWTPPDEGLYTIVASFDGSDSYYSSFAETRVGVSASAQPAVAPTPTSPTPINPTPTAIPSASPLPTQVPQPTSGTSTATYVAISVAVIVVVIALAAIVLRRKK
jgi:outer membrane protein assembly factor BamB